MLKSFYMTDFCSYAQKKTPKNWGSESVTTKTPSSFTFILFIYLFFLDMCFVGLIYTKENTLLWLVATYLFQLM